MADEQAFCQQKISDGGNDRGEEDAHAFFALVEKLLKTAKFPGAKISKIDGLRADYTDGFGLIRASNTTPVLVLRFEGHTPKALHRIEADFMAALRRVKPDAQIAAAAH